MAERVAAVPLRLRVTLLYVVLGLAMTLLFAGVILFFVEDYEHVLVEEVLRSEAEDYAVRLRSEPATILPRSSRLSGYLRRNDGSGEVPDALAALPPGVHELARPGRDGIHAAVFDTGVGRLYFTINLEDIERLEAHIDWILAAAVVLGTLFSAWLGWLLSGSVVRPVRRLADAVDALSTEPERTHLASGLPRDALGRLGQAIDDYQARLLADQQAERAFFADASHELRTPIAVVRGATELLVEDGEQFPMLHPRLRRLERGVRQVSELTDALLGLARRRVGAIHAIALREWVAGRLRAADALADGRVDVDLAGTDPRYCLPTHEAALILNGIVRQLVAPGTTGVLQVRVDDAGFTLRLLDEAATDGDGQQAGDSSDRGFGLTLLGRLAAHIGWRIDEDPARREVRVSLPDGSRAPLPERETA